LVAPTQARTSSAAAGPVDLRLQGLLFAGRMPENALHHDDLGLNRSKIIKPDRFNELERDAGAKPLCTFAHPALGRDAKNAARFSRQSHSKSLDLITFVILDQFDLKS
jgi:hypothetical protein